MEYLTAVAADLLELIRDAFAEYGIDTEPAEDLGGGGVEMYALIPGCGSRPVRVPVELKDRSQPLGAAEADRWSQRRTSPTILAQPSVPRVRGAQYRALGINYIDSGGNAYLKFPGFHVHVEGRKPRLLPRTSPARGRAAATPTGLRVIFALLTRPEVVEASYEKLAELALVSKGSVTNAVSDLRRQGHLIEIRGRRKLVDQDRLTINWIDGYIRDLAPKLQQLELEGRGPAWWVEHWSQPDGTLGGGVALAELGGHLRTDRTVIYGDPPWHSIRQQARLSRESSAPVILRERFWAPALLEDARLVPPLLAYADAIASGDPREAEVARELDAREQWGFRR